MLQTGFRKAFVYESLVPFPATDIEGIYGFFESMPRFANLREDERFFAFMQGIRKEVEDIFESGSTVNFSYYTCVAIK